MEASMPSGWRIAGAGAPAALNHPPADADDSGMPARTADSHVLSSGLDETRETLAGWREDRRRVLRG